MGRCLKCAYFLFFTPLPSDTYSCCSAWGEGVKDIDLGTGVSPAIKKYHLGGSHCKKFEPGTTICRVDQKPKDPFWLHPVRKKGEKILLRLLSPDH